MACSTGRAAARALRGILIDDGHLGDWLVAALLVAQAFVLPVYVVPPLKRFMPPGDPATSYPHVPVPLTEAQKWLLLSLAPLAAGALCNLPALARSGALFGGGAGAAAAGGRRAAAAAATATATVVSAAVLDVHHLWLAALEAFAVEASFKKWMNLVGRPRPDYQWRAAHGQDVAEGLFSYPSGHAAEMFAVGTVLALYFLGRARVLSPAADAAGAAQRWGGQLALAAACLLPLAGATLVALSRVAGYRHDFSDINAGMGIGLCCGGLGYLLNFEAPTGERAGVARSRGAVVAAAQGGGVAGRRRKDDEGGRPLLGGEEAAEEEEEAEAEAAGGGGRA